MGMLRTFADGLANALTGAGTNVDRRTFARYAATAVDEQQILSSYRTSWLMRKVVDLPAGDMTREWRDWQVEKDRIAEIEAAEKAIGLRDKVRLALVRARLGGGAIILGVDQGTVGDPLNVDAIRPLSLKYLHVVSRFAVTLGQPINDLNDPLFGEPSFFELRGAGTSAKIHPSRVITFKGLPVPDASGVNFNDSYWGDPLFQSISDAVKNADAAQGGFASLIDEARTKDWAIPGMNQRLAEVPGYDAQLMKQIGIVEQAVSMHRARIHDADETVTASQVVWAGMPEIIRTYLSIVAGAADIPATRLLGKAPDGMNSTGEGDERNYLASIASQQDTMLRPQLDRLDAVILRSAGIDMTDLDYRFAPLSRPTEKEAADIGKVKADTAKIYADSGLVPIDALARGVQNMLVEDGAYPGLDDALNEFPDSGDDGQDPSAITEPKAIGADVVPLRRAANDRRFQDATPRTLYVQRKLLNARELIAWAKGQGFETTTPAEDMHVTITYSRTAVDWMKMGGDSWGSDTKGELVVAPGGARLVEPLGDKGAVVLLFASSPLAWRHEEMVRNGASHDFPEYQPHVTITYDKPTGLDIGSVEPFCGELRFGPEIFEELDPDFKPGEK